MTVVMRKVRHLVRCIRQARLLDLAIVACSVAALVAAMVLSFEYVNNENPRTTPFYLRKDTYDKLFPFLLGTVAVGGFVFTYTRIQRSREEEFARRKAEKAIIERRIRRLQEIYTIVLTLFQDIRLQRRRLGLAFIFDQDDGHWKVRRTLLEGTFFELSKSQLAGEKIVKTLKFDQDALKSINMRGDGNSKGNQLHDKFMDDLRSQIGGVGGVLRNVLKLVQWQSVTAGTSDDESLVVVPQDFVDFLQKSSPGNLGFLKMIQFFNKFSKNIRLQIAILEAEFELYGDV